MDDLLERLEKLESSLKDDDLSLADKDALLAEQADIREEIARIRESDEVRQLSERVEMLEGQGRTDAEITAELQRRGVSRTAAQMAMQVHLEEHPDHDQRPKRFEQRGIDDMLGDPMRRPPQDAAPMYQSPAPGEKAPSTIYSAETQAYTPAGGSTPPPGSPQDAMNPPYRRNTADDDTDRRRAERVGDLRIGGEYVGYQDTNAP